MKFSEIVVPVETLFFKWHNTCASVQDSNKENHNAKDLHRSPTHLSTSSCVKRGDEKTCSFRDVTESIVKRKISRLC